jgi:hypothetical protein
MDIGQIGLVLVIPIAFILAFMVLRLKYRK